MAVGYISRVLVLICGILLAVSGAAWLLFPRRFAGAATNRHAARVAELESGAPEAHFEELRELKAYPPPARPETVRLMGGISMLLCAAFAVLSFF